MTAFRLPDDWNVLPSAVEGIEVWGPGQQEAPDAPDGGYRCEQCGGGVSYEIARGAAACGWCDHVAVDFQRDKGGTRADAFTDEAIARATQGWALNRRELHCDGCGVDLAVEPGDLATSCAFCGSNQVLLRDSAVQSLRPNAVLPFQFTGEQLPTKLKSWLGQGWYHPSDLGSRSLLDKLSPIYVPFWAFDAISRTRWRAEVGTERTRTVTRNGRRTTETVIDWSWRDGGFSMDLNGVIEPGSKQLQRTLVRRVSDFDLAGLRDYNPGLLAGWRAQAYDIGLTEAWDEGRRHMRERVRRSCEADTGSKHVRNMSVEADFDEERWRYVLLPLYVGAYRYQGRTFNVLINGQTGTIAGQRPVVWARIWLVAALSFTPALLLTVVSLPLMLVGVGFALLPFALILFFLAMAFAIGLVRTAQQAEARE